MNRDQASMLIAGRDWKTPTFFRLFMPYLYQRVEMVGRKHAFLPLNRDYVPLGHRRGEASIDYDQVAPTHAVYFRRDPAALEGIWWNVRDKQLWLYDDDPTSRTGYFERLEKLMTRQMEMVA